jgi:hypothetical protein
VECSHDSGRQFAIMFFGLCCSYRILLEIFDEQVNNTKTLSFLFVTDTNSKKNIHELKKLLA